MKVELIMRRLLTFFQQAWIRKDGEEEARSTMTECLNLIRQDSQENYIEFIRHYGPALAGIRVWNQNKAVKTVSDLLTITDEAFIHLCIINYGGTWRAQAKFKRGDKKVVVLVRNNISMQTKN